MIPNNLKKEIFFSNGSCETPSESMDVDSRFAEADSNSNDTNATRNLFINFKTFHSSVNDKEIMNLLFKMIEKNFTSIIFGKF